MSDEPQQEAQPASRRRYGSGSIDVLPNGNLRVRSAPTSLGLSETFGPYDHSLTKARAVALLVAVASGDPVPAECVADFLSAILATPGIGEAVAALHEPAQALHHATRAAVSFLKVDEAVSRKAVER